MAIPFDRIQPDTGLFNNWEWIVARCEGDICGVTVYGRPCAADGRRRPSHCLEIAVSDLKQLQKLAKLAAKHNMSLLESDVAPRMQERLAKNQGG